MDMGGWVQHTVGGTIPRWVGFGGMRKLAKQVREQASKEHSSVVPTLSSYPDLP